MENISRSKHIGEVVMFVKDKLKIWLKSTR